jgi:hypothetical protein
MTGTGVIVAVALGLVVLVWVLTLVRHDRLYVGYGVIFVFGTIAALVVLGVPPLQRRLVGFSEALVPAPSLMLIPVVFLSLLILYLFTQISVLANRVTRLTQELAIRDAQRQRRGESSPTS